MNSIGTGTIDDDTPCNHSHNGRMEVLPADTVVLATGVQENGELEDALKSLQSEFFKIGDCQSPREAIDAVHEGFRAATK